MPQSGKQESNKGRGDSLLPSHANTPQAAVGPTSTPQVVVEPEKPNENLEAYNAADAKLLELEEELDVLIHCALSLREQRTKMSLKRLTYLDDGTTTFEGSNGFIDEYVALAKKGKSIDDLIKKLKEECAACRSECDFIFSKIYSPGDRLRQGLRHKESLADGRPESGFVDTEAIADRVINAESTATNAAGVVGAFGAGITYTTLFSASRGRLDLISWAFTCFLIVVIDCTALQLFALPRHGHLARIMRSGYPGSVENRLLTFMALVGIPLVTGFILLGISVATLDNHARTVMPGSGIAIKASGYLSVAILGYFVISMAVLALGAIVIRLLPQHLRPGPQNLNPAAGNFPPSAIFPLQEKLHFLPGGPGYIHYREKRRRSTRS